MKLNDGKKSIINITNVCRAWAAEAQMGSQGPGMNIRFSGGSSQELFSYEDPEALDGDLRRIEGTIDKLENPDYYYELSGRPR